MKTQLADRKLYLPFLLVVRALGISKTRLHNWLSRQEVYLDATHERDYAADGATHRRYSRLDLVRLGFVDRMTTMGIPPRRASEFFEDLLTRRYDMRSRTKRDPEARLLEFLRGSTVAINALDTGEGGFGWPQLILITDGLRFGKQKRNPRIPAECDTSITIDIGAMMKKQDQRLNAAITEGLKQGKRIKYVEKLAGRA